MTQSSNKLFKSSSKAPRDNQYEEFVDMLESGMEDYEIASELGLQESYISKIKREIYNDLI